MQLTLGLDEVNLALEGGYFVTHEALVDFDLLLAGAAEADCTSTLPLQVAGTTS